MSDSQESCTDHDVLIKLEANQRHICKTLEDLQYKMDQLINSNNKKLSWGQFIVVLTIFIGIVGGIISMNYMLDFKQQDQITQIQSLLNVHDAVIGLHHKKP